MNYREFAISVAKEAGNLLMRHYGKMQKLEWKLATNFKTQVDDESDKLIRERIKENFPKHNIYSEEQDAIEQKSEYNWVIDPLDGTIPYAYGISDHFTVCVALVRNKTPILGVTYAPKRKELYVAEKGKGASCNGEKITSSLEDELNHAIIALEGGKATKFFNRKSIVPYVKNFYGNDGVVCALSSGCASVPLALVASGKMHAYVALSLEPWDMAAGVILNREVGNMVTTIYGKDWELGDESIVAANQKMHEEVMRLVRKSQQ